MLIKLLIPKSTISNPILDKSTHSVVYSSGIEIGNQTWMKINLDVDKFRHGNPIHQTQTNEE